MGAPPPPCGKKVVPPCPAYRAGRKEKFKKQQATRCAKVTHAGKKKHFRYLHFWSKHHSNSPICPGRGGGTLPSPVPSHVFAYIRANARTSLLKKMTFQSYQFGKGQYTFFPIKLCHFAAKNTVCWKCQNFIS